MLNFGDLEILTAAEMANDRYHMLKDPKGFKKVMLTQKNSLERSFSAGPPTPPLRAEQPMAPFPRLHRRAAAPSTPHQPRPRPRPQRWLIRRAAGQPT